MTVAELHRQFDDDFRNTIPGGRVKVRLTLIDLYVVDAVRDERGDVILSVATTHASRPVDGSDFEVR